MPLETYEAVLSGNLGGQFVQTVLHFTVNNTGTTNPYLVAKDLAETLTNTSGWIDEFMKVLPTAYTATSIRVRRKSDGGGPTYIVLGAAFADATGDRTGGIQTFQANPLLIWITSTNPDKPGKTYLPGVSETDADGGFLTSAFVTAVDAFIVIAIDTFSTDTLTYACEFAIWRRESEVANSIMGGRISPKIAVQKRRALPF